VNEPGPYSNDSAVPVRIIEPHRGFRPVEWGELYAHRELLYFLVWREVKLRYKQTALGVAWVVLQPALTMAVFVVFFGRLAGLGQTTGGTPYALFVLAGLLPWNFFANAVSAGANSLLGSVQLVTKVYFPRLLVPLATVVAGLVDLAVGTVLLLLLMVYYRAPMSAWIVLAPVVLAAMVLSAGGISIVAAALTVAYRDFRYVVPFALQLGLFVTPVIYPSHLVPARWRWLLGLNPMAGLVEGFRGAILGGPIDFVAIAVSLTASLLVFWAGAAFFKKTERGFADII
jgi:lipopolysaccharide transport system permease protein